MKFSLDGKKTFSFLTAAMVIQVLRLFGVDVSPEDATFLTENWDALGTAFTVAGAFWSHFVTKRGAK